MVSVGPGAEQPAHRLKVDKPLADSEIYIKICSAAARAGNYVTENASRPRLQEAGLFNSSLAARYALPLHPSFPGLGAFCIRVHTCRTPELQARRKEGLGFTRTRYGRRALQD